MADLSISNLAQILQKYPEIGKALQDVQNATNNIGQQTSASPVGTTETPTSHAALSVKGGSGIYDVQITDNSPKYKGHENFIEYTENNWESAHVLPLGPSRNWRGSLGPGPYQFRSYAQYPTSKPSEYVYHPHVSASGTQAPAMQGSQGSGTSQTPGSGYGHAPYNTPKPPIR